MGSAAGPRTGNPEAWGKGGCKGTCGAGGAQALGRLCEPPEPPATRLAVPASVTPWASEWVWVMCWPGAGQPRSVWGPLSLQAIQGGGDILCLRRWRLRVAG